MRGGWEGHPRAAVLHQTRSVAPTPTPREVVTGPKLTYGEDGRVQPRATTLHQTRSVSPTPHEGGRGPQLTCGEDGRVTRGLPPCIKQGQHHPHPHTLEGREGTPAHVRGGSEGQPGLPPCIKQDQYHQHPHLMRDGGDPSSCVGKVGGLSEGYYHASGKISITQTHTPHREGVTPAHVRGEQEDQPRATIKQGQYHPQPMREGGAPSSHVGRMGGSTEGYHPASNKINITHTYTHNP